MPGSRELKKKGKKKKSSWNQEEIEKFRQFLVSNKSLSCFKEGSRIENQFFTNCAKFIGGSRTSKQCKNHFYKSYDAWKVDPIYKQFFLARNKFRSEVSTRKTCLSSQLSFFPPSTYQSAFYTGPNLKPELDPLPKEENQSELLQMEQKQELLSVIQENLKCMEDILYFTELQEKVKLLLYQHIDDDK